MVMRLCSLCNTLKPSGQYIYHQLKVKQIVRSTHTVYLCVLC